MQNLIVDGVEYRVRVVYGSLKRSFEIVEGPNAGVSITGRDIRDILGTGYTYELTIEPDPRFIGDYDSLYDIISSPVEAHSVTLPYGQTWLAFDAFISSGTDTLGPTIAGETQWRSLTITFKPVKPQKGA